ncbi:hypothetical protein [Arvimicrobium flavum]|nr:hypothetical protein [Mesorhizobium shangrilense]
MTAAVTFALSFPLAIATYHFIEAPMATYRKRRISRRASGTRYETA